MSQFRMALVCAGLMVMAGCSGVGDGTKPESGRIVQATLEGTLPTDALTAEVRPGRAYTCVRSALVLFVTFSNGSVGSFTDRAVWTSSNPAVVSVSNADFNNPDDRLTIVNPDILDPATPDARLVFGPGSLAPKAVGRATITADFVGLRTSLEVEVLPSGELHIVPENAHMVPRSSRDYRVETMLDQDGDGDMELTDVSRSSVLAFENADAGAVDNPELPADTDRVANFTLLTSGASRLNALIASPALTMRAQSTVDVPACQTDARIASTAVDVRAFGAQSDGSPDVTLKLDYEPGEFGPQAVRFGAGLAESTSQFLQLTAQFGDLNGNGTVDDAEFQDLTAQASPIGDFNYDRDADSDCEVNTEPVSTTAMPLTLPDPVVAFNGFLEPNRVVALRDTDSEDETTLVCARFGRTLNADGTVDQPGAASNSLDIAVIDRPPTLLEVFAIPPTAARPAVDACPSAFDVTAPCIQLQSADVSQPLTGTFLNFNAVASFADSPEGPVHVQPVTRNVLWSTSVETIALIGLRTNTALSSGQLLALPREAGSAPVTVSVAAVFDNGTLDVTTDDVRQERTLTVNALAAAP